MSVLAVSVQHCHQPAVARIQVQSQKTTPVQVSYSTDEVVILSAKEKVLVRADADCGHVTGAKLTVCAELRENWQWNPFGGFVSMDIFNSSAVS